MPVSRVSFRYPGPRKFVHIKLLVSSVSFSHNNVRILMVYRPYAKFAYRATCRFRDYKAYTESNGQTDRQYRQYRQTVQTDNYSNSRCACARGLIIVLQYPLQHTHACHSDEREGICYNQSLNYNAVSVLSACRCYNR